MRITIMGSGGVGGYFGARLANGGCDVGFVARGEHLSAMREHGLRVESELGNIDLPLVRASDDPVELGPADVVLFCVKLWDTETAAQAIKPIVGSETAIISLQNGVQKDEVLGGILGTKHVMGGLCYIGSKILKPGVIQHTGKMQRLVFGEYGGGVSPRAEAFLQACRNGGIDADISAKIEREIWEKFVFLVGFSAATTSMNSTIGPIMANDRTRKFLLDVMKEVVATGRARGVELDEQFAENRLAFSDGLPPGMTSSMHNDLQQRRRLEVDWLSGGVVELAEKFGLEAPLNRAVRDILALRVDGE